MATWAVALTDLSRAEFLLPACIGLTCALLAFVFGGALAGRRRQLVLPPPPPTEHDPFEEADSSDRRSDLRRSGNPVEVEIALDEIQLTHGRIVDRSVGGLCLLVEKAVKEGTVVNIRPTGASRQIPWTPIAVRSCRQEGSEWQLGCQYVHTPPWSVRMLFG